LRRPLDYFVQIGVGFVHTPKSKLAAGLDCNSESKTGDEGVAR